MATFLSNGTLAEEAVTIVSSASIVYLTVDSATHIKLTGTVAQTFKLANAKTLVPGIRFFIGNRTSQIATVQYQDGSQADIITPNSQIELRLISNTSTNGDWDIAFSGGGVIGTAEDGSYEDGLFPDFTATTPISTPIDRFNEVLKELAPSAAPVLSTISLLSTGVSGRLSFDGSHVIPGYTPVTVTPAVFLNGLYSTAGYRYGIYAPASKTGRLAAETTANTQNAYPAYAFGNGDTGTLSLEVNGVVIHSVDLSTAGAGTDLNINGSGFTLSAATSVLFPNGNSFSLFKYRTGQFIVAVDDQQDGQNTARVIHTILGTDHVTNLINWVVDSTTDLPVSTAGNLHTLAMNNVRYISGVAYHTTGTARYDVTLYNTQLNVYSNGSVVTFNGTNCSSPAQSLPAVAAPNYELDPVLITNAPVTVSTANRLLNGTITVSVNCPHPLKAAISTGSPSSITNLLFDPIQTASTDVREYFDSETIRLVSNATSAVNNYAAQADVANGTWSSTQNIMSGLVGYTDGLLYYNGMIVYPTQGVLSGNFSGVANGPVGNPNYSTASGNRYLYLKFRNNSGLTKSNFRINLLGTGTFIPSSTVPSGQNITLEMKFPTGSISSGTGWMDCYRDFVTNTWTDGSGCRLATQGTGQAFATNWGLTLGTLSLAANEYLVFRVAASAAWTGNINDIQLTFL